MITYSSFGNKVTLPVWRRYDKASHHRDPKGAESTIHGFEQTIKCAALSSMILLYKIVADNMFLLRP